MRSQQFPLITATPSVSSARISGTRPVAPGTPESAFVSNTLSLPADISYLVDLWGSVRRQLESANAFTQASVAQYENVLLTLKSDVATTYFMLRGLETDRAVLKKYGRLGT